MPCGKCGLLLYGHTALIAATITWLRNHRHAHTADITHLHSLYQETVLLVSVKMLPPMLITLFSGA